MDTLASPLAFAGALANVIRPVVRLTEDTVTDAPFTAAVTSVSSRFFASTWNWVAEPLPMKVLMRLGVSKLTAS